VEAINAFIPAAGFGERLRPITDSIPKPLLPVLGRPIIEIVLERVSLLSPGVIAINVHHCHEQMLAWHESSPHKDKITLMHEDPILGTGGAIKNASAVLKGSAFLVHNADILSDIDLAALMKGHEVSGNIATLAVHDCAKYANVWVDSCGTLQYVGSKMPGHDPILCKIAFMGIAVYSPDFLKFLPDGPSTVVDAWRNALAEGQTIGTLDFSGAAWTDIGTPNAYAAAVFDAMKKQGEMVYVHPSFDCSNAEVLGNVVIEKGSSCKKKSSLHNSIVLPGTAISHGTHVEQKIIGPGFALTLAADEIFEAVSLSSPLLASCGYPNGMVTATRIGTGGSDRTYHRIPGKAHSRVLMTCAADDKDFERHLALTGFFREHGVPVPAILMADHKERQALLEDLGDLSLYSWLACRKSPDQIARIYKKIIDILVILHGTVTDHAADCPSLLERRFDRDHLRWETSYFMANYARKLPLSQMPVQDLLDAEFDRLAETVALFEAAVLHRDFQSQNIMVVHGDEPRIIDFQGARLGPAAYDIASLLWDPYYRLEEGIREALLSFYVMRRRETRPGFDEKAFRETLLPCRLQRHMQALGAYGFLSMVKGKKSFLRHIPQALAYLKQETELTSETYPTLYRLVSGLS
jgi:NDP-sugar pyrophosphorylase family protein/aminoglycoside/choline kinase family phosphotransferase